MTENACYFLSDHLIMALIRKDIVLGTVSVMRHFDSKHRVVKYPIIKGNDPLNQVQRETVDCVMLVAFRYTDAVAVEAQINITSRGNIR